MDSSVAYDGTWSRNASLGDAMNWYRSTSTSATAGATVTVPFRGTGIDVIGGNDGSAVLDVLVDGRAVARNAKTTATDKRQATYSLRGLPDGRHTATFTLKSGKIVLDAFTALSGDVDGPVDTTPLRTALDTVGSPDRTDYTADSWADFTTARTAARAAVRGQKGLDALGVGQLANRLVDAYDKLVRTGP
jgi:hypothetical protein